MRLLPILFLTALSGCYLFIPPARFNAEVEALRREADQRFPVGSSATEFEAWFKDKAGDGLHVAPSALRENDAAPLAHSASCQRRVQSFQREEGCMHQLAVYTCVDPGGRLQAMRFKPAGYC